MNTTSIDPPATETHARSIAWRTLLAYAIMVTFAVVALGIVTLRATSVATRIDHNQQAIVRTQASLDRHDLLACQRGNYLRAHINHNTTIIHAALVLLADAWATHPQLTHSAGALRALAADIGIEDPVDCSHPDGDPPFIPFGP